MENLRNAVAEPFSVSYAFTVFPMEPIDVVISGIGGRFPGANNIEELREQLLAGKSRLKPTTRWNPGAKSTPRNIAETSEFEKFDSTFFGMHPVVASMTDPTARAVIEIAFEAIVDAGVNPSSLRGTNTQVYSGVTHFEGDCVFDGLVNPSGYAILGRNRCMAANRISYCLSLNGRSSAYDGMCGWVGDGLQAARSAIQCGECETAIVLGTTVSLFLSHHENRHALGLLSSDSELHPFDDKVGGYGRGEAQIAFLVQRADVAKRSYGSIVLAAAESQGSLPNWFLSVNEDHLRNFVRSQYHKNDVDPSKVQILEADGLCNKDMVETELKVLDEVLNAGRPKNSPLYLGTVKTIIGESEGAGGLAALTKLILALETGIISPTLNCGKLNPNIQGLVDGRFKVVKEPTKFEVTPETVVAVSSVSHNGIVAHVALKANGKTKEATLSDYDCPLPYLVLMSGRNADIVERSLQRVTSSPFDPEYLRLTQEVFSSTIQKFESRGYGFHGQDSSQKFVIQQENRRPVWFVYSGMGSQWGRCGKNLMLIPVFRDTMHRLHKILEPKGMNLLNIVTLAGEEIFDNILNSFVCITAFQIALTNLMTQLGIVPEGIIGHSVGELGCSYADGCLTEEQTILASYARGIASLKADLIPGLMAAVGVGGDEAQKILPPEVVVACRNSSENCTISGPTEDVVKVVNNLEEKRIFVRKVNVANIAYHSPHIKPAAPYLLSYLREVITSPKLRSPKWICTSAPEDKWKTEEVKYCSAEFHTNNLLSTVYFEEGTTHIPKNALVIELAPHGLLQAILKRSLGADVAHVSLTKRNVSSSIKYLLEAVGKLFLEGQSPKIWHLYPEVSMPVSRNTPSLVPLLGWEHHDDFRVALNLASNDDQTVKIDSSSPSMKLADTICLLPAHILVTTWASFAAKTHRDPRTCAVVFESVEFHDIVKLETTAIDLHTFVMTAEGKFECYVDDTLIVNGKIRSFDETYDTSLKQPCLQGDAILCLGSDDVYSEMRSKCLEIPDDMRSIHELQIYTKDWIADIDFRDGNWSRLLNSLLIMFQLRSSEGNLSPASVNYIQRLVIDPGRKNLGRRQATNIVVPAFLSVVLVAQQVPLAWQQVFDLFQLKQGRAARLHLSSSTLLFDGVEIFQVNFKAIDRPALILEPDAHHFVPFGEAALKSEENFLIYIIQLCLERSLTPQPVFKILDLTDSSLSQKLQAVLHSTFHIKSEVSKDWQDVSLIVSTPALIQSVSAVAASENILVLSECDDRDQNDFKKALDASGLRAIAKYKPEETSKRIVASISCLRSDVLHDCKIIKMSPQEDVPLTVTRTSKQIVVLVWEQGSWKSPSKIYSEIAALEGAEKLRLVFLMTPDTPKFSLDLPLYSEQLQLNMPVNVYFNGQWGNYRVIPVRERINNDSISDIFVGSHTPTNGIEEVTLRCIGLNREETIAEEGFIELHKSIVDFSGEYVGNIKMMGVAIFDDASGCYLRDPILTWPVPNEWTFEDAATVPCAFSYAFFVLLEVARLRRKETVLITCPLTPVGQAALRIAFSLECDPYVMLESISEKNELKKIFPNLNDQKIVISRTGELGFTSTKDLPLKVEFILSHLPIKGLKACIPCLIREGRIVQINSEPMLARDAIGTIDFLKLIGLYGVSEKSLLKASPDVKIRVNKWLQEGISNGIVKPNKSRQRYAANEMQKAKQMLQGNDVTKRLVHLPDEGKRIGNKKYTVRNSQCVLIGGSKTHLIKLANYLADKGSKHLLVTSEHFSPSFFARHASILRRKFNADLRNLVVAQNGAGTLQEVTKSGPIEAVFVFEHNEISENIIREIHSRSWRNIQLVFLSMEPTNFTRMSELWVQKGFKVKAAVGVYDIPLDRLTPMLDWLLSSASPTVSNFSGQGYSVQRSYFASVRDGKLLPLSATELVQLGTSIRGKATPVFREITTRCTCARVTREINPLFYIKGVHGQASLDVETIAADLLAPLFEVTLHETTDNLQATAEAVVQGMLRIQTKGPFNIAGDSIRSNLILRVAGILERKDFASVAFLKDDCINNMRKEMSALQTGNRLSSSILGLCLSGDGVMQKGWKSVDWGQLSWEEQVSTALSKVGAMNEDQISNVTIALTHVKVSIEHMIEGQEIALKYGVIHSIRKGDHLKEFNEGERRHVHNVPTLASNSRLKKISEIYSSNLATPELQLNLCRSKRDIS